MSLCARNKKGPPLNILKSGMKSPQRRAESVPGLQGGLLTSFRVEASVQWQNVPEIMEQIHSLITFSKMELLE